MSKPYSRNNLNDSLLKALFEGEVRRLQECLDGIVDKNRAQQRGGPNSSLCFRASDGGLYISSKTATRPGPKTQWPSLERELYPEFLTYRADAAVIDQDRREIQQLLFMITVGCLDRQDHRDTLPDFMANLLPELAALPRKLAEHCYLRDNIHAMDSWRAILPKIEFYSAARLMY
jgi:hypothetical protein